MASLAAIDKAGGAMQRMHRLGDDAGKILASMGADPALARRQARGVEVRRMWRELMEHNHDEFILAHTNNVYIISAEARERARGKRYYGDGKDASSTGEGKQLIVYVDDSAVSAELNARRELIKLQFLQHFGEEIDEFKILISRGVYKDHHPFVGEEVSSYNETVRSVPLDEREQAFVIEQRGKAANPRVARALERAMTADMEWKKGIGASPSDSPSISAERR